MSLSDLLKQACDDEAARKSTLQFGYRVTAVGGRVDVNIADRAADLQGAQLLELGYLEDVISGDAATLLTGDDGRDPYAIPGCPFGTQ